MSSNLQFFVKEFNDVAKDFKLVSVLRSLTLNRNSGMNNELTTLSNLATTRKVNCKVLLCYDNTDVVGWALVSRESSEFNFFGTCKGFSVSELNGVLFEVFVKSSHRRRGIGSEFIKMAKKRAGTKHLCISPWDKRSQKFFSNFEHYKHRKI